MSREISSQKLLYSPGQQIKTIRTSNNFLIEGCDETGGMGLVLFARRKRDQRLYALKTLKGWQTEAKQLIELTSRFRKEALVWITLAKHHNVVQAFWFDLDECYRPFLIMEYVEGDPRYGVSLRQWLQKEKCFEPLRAIGFALEALCGLIYAKRLVNHELGIPFVHRDIKPENLLIAKDGCLKVTDFGLVMGGGGTFVYMPPEQWQGNAIEEKTDVYALGCVLYEMLEGRPPHTGMTKRELRHKHSSEEPAPLQDIPEPLSDLLMRSLAKSPDQRPNFQELQDGLQSMYSELAGAPFALADGPEPLSAEDLNARGSGFDELGHYERAIACYTAAIASDPRDLRFYLNRALAQFAVKDLDGAWEDYHTALALDPQAVEVYLGLGTLLAHKGDYDKALEYYHKAEEVDPQEPMICVGLGNLYAQQEHYAEAEGAFRKALALNQNSAEAYLGLGNVQVCHREYQEAEKCYQEAIRLNPLYSQAYLNLARLYQLWGRRYERDRIITILARIEPGMETVTGRSES